MDFRLNLKVKFTLTICCLLAVSVISLGWIFLLQVEESALRVLREKGTILVQGLASGSELAVLTHDPDHLEAALGPLRDQVDVVYAGVADERGAILSEHRIADAVRVPEWAAPAVDPGTEGPAFVAVQPPGDGPAQYFVSVPIRAGRRALFGEDGMLLGEGSAPRANGRLGTACIGLSTGSVMKEIGRLRRGLVLATLAVLVAGVAIAVFLVRVIVEPVKQLVRATERIAAGDLDTLLPRRGRDEIGALAVAFNQMTVHLRESRRALERSNSDLERKVEERTGALKEAQGQLIQAEKMTVVGQLVSGVAHELNNPLAGVLGYAQLLLRKGALGETRQGLLKIEAEAGRCKRIVQNLLIFARHHKPRKTLLDLNAVIESTLEMRDYHLRTDNITALRDLDPDLPRTMADMNQIQQVLMNMINNAQHAMLEVQRPHRMSIATRHHAGRIQIRLADNGSGIRQEHLPRIFDPFFTTKEVGRGTGLGLSICYGIIQEHRGAIRVESTPGKGTVFEIELPVQGEGDATGPEATEPREVAGEGPPPRTGRILLVDDETSILEVLGDVLRLDGHLVEAERDGIAALRRLRQERFDVVVSDLKMPGMGGQELFARLADIDPSLVRRLVFTTGDLANPETLKFLESAGNPYLQKPFDLNAVRSIVQRLLAAA
ncbi:MAG: HAMP domain-containing protein [Acidobacteria bacterium]|nr:HAMP domain-containing protein [Acidobacteriota bacterium]